MEREGRGVDNRKKKGEERRGWEGEERMQEVMRDRKEKEKWGYNIRRQRRR